MVFGYMSKLFRPQVAFKSENELAKAMPNRAYPRAKPNCLPPSVGESRTYTLSVRGRKSQEWKDNIVEPFKIYDINVAFDDTFHLGPVLRAKPTVNPNGTDETSIGAITIIKVV